MATRGRKSIYDTVILPNLDNIKQWLSNGATEKQVCEVLGISVSAFNSHKEKEELKNTIKGAKSKLIIDLRGELVKQATRHTLETKKTYLKKDEVTGNKTQYTEITTKEVDGNLSAIHLLLKNLDREEWKNDWDNYEMKQAELELRKMMATQKDKEW